jgi:Kef-type K+ transport system membrane component KefB
VRRAFSRQQKMTILFAIMLVVVMIVVLQLWLLTATMNAFLAGQERVILPAAMASIVCFGLNLGLLSYIYRMERR